MDRYRRLLSYLWPYRMRALATLSCMGVLAVTTAMYAFMVGPLLAFLVTGDYKAAIPSNVSRWMPDFDPGAIDREKVLVALPVVLVTIAVVKGASYAGQFFLTGTIAQDVVADLRRALFNKLVAMPPSFYARRHTGDLYSRIATDVQYIENAINWSVASYVREPLQIIVLLVNAFAIDWRLSLIAFGAVPLTVYPVLRFAKRLKKITTQSNEAISQMMQTTHEAIGGIRVVQAFGMEPKERERYDSAVRKYVGVMRKSLANRALSTPTMEIIAVAGLGAAIAYAGRAVASGHMDGRMLMSFMATVLLMYQPAKSLGKVGNFMMQGIAGAERVFELLDTPVEITDRPGAREVPEITRELAFERLSFRYASPDEKPLAGTQPVSSKWVLRDLDLRVRKGEVVALVGPSGSGKSSLANLVPRFYDATEGRVAIDGVDIRDMTLASLRRQIAVVTQETVLFNESVAANIAYGRPGATREQIEAAARAADAHEFIQGLPQGYETRVGEKGVMLSGGQRQRLAIARALLKDAPILILDEATSALDAESEAEVQRALERLMKDRTVLVIAHRLSTIRNADRIVVLVDGQVAEEGTHAALVATGGEYARMIDIQHGNHARVAVQ